MKELLLRMEMRLIDLIYDAVMELVSRLEDRKDRTREAWNRERRREVGAWYA